MSTKLKPAKSNLQRATADAITSLVTRAQKGDRQAFEEIVRLHESYVYRMCLAILRSEQDAEDASQDTFLNAYRSLASFRGEARFSTWLARIAVNESLQRLRKQKPVSSVDEFLEMDEEWVPLQVEEWQLNPEQLYSTDEIRRIVEEAIWALPVPYRIAFVLRDICDHSTEEVAEALDLTVPAVKSRLLRARLMVRERLARRFKKASGLKGKLLHVKVLLRGLVDRFCRTVGLRR